MNRRTKLLLAGALVTLVSAGSFGAALAVTGTRSASVSSTQALTACATGGGVLRLPDGSGKCPKGTTAVQLARPATAPHAAIVSLSGRATRTTKKTIPLIAGVSLVAACHVQSMTTWDGSGALQIVHTGATQIDGTAFVAENGPGSTATYQYVGGQPLTTAAGPSEFFANGAGTLGVGASDLQPHDFVTENVHLLVTVAGAAFTVTAVLDLNGDANTCRVSTEVETAAA